MSLCDRRILRNLKARRRAHQGIYRGFRASPNTEIKLADSKYLTENGDHTPNLPDKGKPL